MRVHFVMNTGGTPEAKLADVELFFEEGLLNGLKLVGCSLWKTKKGDDISVLVPSRSYAAAGGVRYFDLLRNASDENKTAVVKFKDFLKAEYLKIVTPQTAAEVN